MRAGLTLFLAVALALPVHAAGAKEEIPLRVRTLDVSADTLPAGQGEFHLGWLAYHHGIVDGFQLSTHVMAWLGTVGNLTARVQLLEREELRVTAQLAGYWLLPTGLAESALELGEGEEFTYLQFPTELRGTIPLARSVELNLATHHTLLWMSTGGVRQSGFFFAAEAGLSLYDRRGSWMLVGRLPIFSRQDVGASVEGVQVLGASITFDERRAWSMMAARDLVFGKSTHLRLGVGFRGRPGIIFLEGLGPLMIQLDLYWR